MRIAGGKVKDHGIFRSCNVEACVRISLKNQKHWKKSEDGDDEEADEKEQDGEAQGAFGSRDVQRLGWCSAPAPWPLLLPSPAGGTFLLLRLLAPPHNQSPPSSRAHSFFFGS